LEITVDELLSILNNIADNLNNFALQLEANMAWYVIDKANIPLQLKTLKEQRKEKDATQPPKKD